MIDRTQIPEIKPIENLILPTPDRYILDNGIPVYVINKGTQEVVKIEIVFLSGRPYEHKKMVSRATASLLKEGTANFTGGQIAETMDFFGNSLSIPVNLDTTSVVLYSLNKNLRAVLPVLSEILSTPTFPQRELEAYVERNKQRMSVDLMQNDVLAYRKITEDFFGKNHPYGYNSTAELYDSLRREDLIKHFKETYIAENCFVFISGKVSDELLKDINEELVRSVLRGTKKYFNNTWQPTPPQKTFIEGLGDSVQTAIRIGCPLFGRNHPDYKGMFVLNNILGGYFGSRLMTNIREEKGLTYNIFSTIDTMMHGGCFYVGTEVSNEFTDQTITEIYKELELLQTEPIKEEELNMVKNYLLGSLLTSLDGPFNIADVFKTLVLDGLPIHDFKELVSYIQNIDAVSIRNLAKKYLKKEDMWEVVVGAKK